MPLFSTLTFYVLSLAFFSTVLSFSAASSNSLGTSLVSGTLTSISSTVLLSSTPTCCGGCASSSFALQVFPCVGDRYAHLTAAVEDAAV